jgi:hypothetical protein
MRRFVLFVLVLSAGAADFAAGAPQNAIDSPPAEVVLSGPASMPLFRKGHGVMFTAVVVNRSDKPIAFVPPRRDWPDEHRLTWEAMDEKGRPVVPLPDNSIWCDVQGVMHMGPLPALQPPNPKPRQIQDADLIMLQPGERYPIAGLADPSFSLKFLKPGVYRVQLSFEFDPAHYRLSKGSKNAAALKNAVSLYAVSLPLTVKLTSAIRVQK